MSYEVKCPHCNETHEIDYEGQDSFDEQCSHCDRVFMVEVDCEPVFNSSKDCKSEGKNHQFIKSQFGPTHYRYECKDCEKAWFDSDAYPRADIRAHVVEQKERAVE